MNPDEYRSGPQMADVIEMARGLDARFSGRVPAFSSGEDAHEAATERADFLRMRRNSDVRTVLSMLDGTEDARREAAMLLLSSVMWQAQRQGVPLS